MPGRQPPVGGPEPRRAVVLTVEHAVPHPADRSHCAWDPGALGAAEALGAALGVPVLAGTHSRLVIDLNRSVDAAASPELLETIWRPFRDEARRRMEAAIEATGRCLHVSVHSFTPDLDPARRTYALGVLFDPDRPAEVAVSEHILDAARAAGFDARANEPYLGTDDGHTTAMRRVWPDPVYAGIELELNQALLGTPAWDALIQVLSDAIG